MSNVKVLFFAADPLSADGEKRRLLLDQEAREIEHEVVVALHRDNVEFRSRWATRIKDLRRELLRIKPQIVHFSGHGSRGAGLVLVATDGMGAHHVGAEALKEFFGVFRDQIRVVVLNACHSKPQAEAIAEAVGCAIGTPAGISDEAAIAFSTAFYSSIAFGKSVQTAFEQARATLRMEDFADHEWPELVHREDVDPSQLVLIQADSAPMNPARRLARPAAAVLLASGAAAAVLMTMRPDPACAPAREVQRSAMSAGTSPQRPLGLLSPPAGSAGPDDPMAGPRELAEANRLHGTGNHAADLPLFRQAAEAGHPEAMTSLGLAYLRGEGTPVQPDSGIKWLREAADKGDPRGMTELGNAYLKREGVERNLDHLAKHWYEKAADEGYPEAMRNLGHLYREGRGLGRGAGPDGARALEWYAKAAKAGLLDAMVDAGWTYEQGLGLPRDRRQAFCWYKAAADAGSARAKVALGEVDENLAPGDTAGE